MRHHKNKRKFGRVRGQRNALLKSLARNLIENNRIITTEAKAKELRPFIEKLITKGKNNTLASKRLIISRLSSTKHALKVFDIAKKYDKRNGGYTRIIKLPITRSDAAKQAAIEFLE